MIDILNIVLTASSSLESLEKLVGSYQGMATAVIVSGTSSFIFEMIAKLKEHTLKLKPVLINILILALMALIMEPFIFIAQFLPKGQDNLILVTAMIVGFFLMVYNLLNIYVQWRKITGIGIIRIDKTLEKEITRDDQTKK